MKVFIPIAKPSLGEEEAAAAREAILSGWVTQGPKVKQFEDMFKAYTGARYACAVSSCTTALHLALLAVGVRPNDIVITVSHSFIATANSIRYCGAEPLFIDIDRDTFNMSADALVKCITEDCELVKGRLFYKKISKLAHGGSTGRIAAMMPVHQIGMPCDMKRILEIARKYRIPVVEDAACAIGSEISLDDGKSWDRIGRPHGDIACFSFHPRKIITTGDGGMLTTNNKKYDNQFRLIRQHGMSISDIARHHAHKIVFEKYNTVGYNYRMTDIQAAIGIEQLKKLPGIITKRRQLARVYERELSRFPWIQTPRDTNYTRTNWQSYGVRVLRKAPISRNALMGLLFEKGIATRRGVMNAHQEEPYRKARFVLKNSEAARDSVILMPLYSDMREGHIKNIAGIIQSAS